MIDFHCHLDLYPDPKHVINECAKHDLYVLSVTTTPSAWQITSSLSNNNKKIRTALGLHPQLAKERKKELFLFDQLISETKYVGEVGLDGSPEFSSFWDEQIEVFEHILKSCSNAGGKIISIHSRRAEAEVLDLLEKNYNAGTFILHWFSGKKKDLLRAIEMGCWFSVGPAMLRTKNGKSIALQIPKERILTETDGPFATIDQKNLMPWDVEMAISELHEILGISSDKIKMTIKDNLKSLLEKHT